MADKTPLVAVLAAGRAIRFGGGKLNADCAGKPLGQWAIDAVTEAGLAPGVIVTGPDAPAFARAARGWKPLPNPQPERGLGTSVALACAEAARQSRGVLLVLADMPLIAPTHLQALLQQGATAATRHPGGRLGVPVHIDAGDVGRFVSLRGDSGAGHILSSLPDVMAIEAPEGSLFDVDDTESLAQASHLLAAR